MLVTRNVEVDTDQFEVGDVIRFTLKNGEEVKAMAAQKVEAGMIFIFVDLLPDYHQMNRCNTNSGGWKKCDLRKWLNEEYIKQFPDDLLSRMIPADGDFLCIPTEKEIFGQNRIAKDDVEPECIEQFEVMKDPRNRISMFKDGTSDWYWLQNRVSASYFASVASYGGAAYGNATYSWVGVRPLFLLSSTVTPLTSGDSMAVLQEV